MFNVSLGAIRLLIRIAVTELVTLERDLTTLSQVCA